MLIEILHTEDIIDICTKFKDAEFRCLVVGGAVRDALLGQEIHDIDLMTTAFPEEVTKIFTRFVPTGIDYGTITIFGKSGAMYEVTSCREDVETDGRRATVVRYTRDFSVDLRRRDFMINALAYDPLTRELFGPGINDDPSQALWCLRWGVVSFVGDPKERIKEDMLRVLRAIRFALKIDGFIGTSSFDAIREAVDAFPGVLSRERVRDELFKILAYREGARFLHNCGLLLKIIPELVACDTQTQNKWHNTTVLEHSLSAAEGAESVESVDVAVIRFAMLLHDIGKPATAEWKNDEYGFSFINHEDAGVSIAEHVCDSLLLDNDTKALVLNIVRNHMSVPAEGASARSIRRFARRVGFDNVAVMLSVRRADRFMRNPVSEEHLQHIQDVLSIVEKTPRKLTIDGHEIMRIAGIEPGPEVGKIKDWLTELVDEDLSLNTSDALTSLLIQRLELSIDK